ncbi:hypothetical protein [Paenibacillus sp. RC84]|uniref:hypothetical protein n=1 Tax=Paenibacillus sp. RC84 TaxID=3156252 RepID=UPI0035185C08
MPKKTRRRARAANVTVNEWTYLPDILKKMRGLSREEVHIGVEGEGEGAMIAAIHEFGSVKAGIPARSFIGTGKKKAQAAISKLAKAGVNEIVLKNQTATGLLIAIGAIGTNRVLKNFDKIRTPELSPIYAKRKGNNKILVQEQKLRDSITSILVRRGGR